MPFSDDNDDTSAKFTPRYENGRRIAEKRFPLESRGLVEMGTIIERHFHIAAVVSFNSGMAGQHSEYGRITLSGRNIEKDTRGAVTVTTLIINSQRNSNTIIHYLQLCHFRLCMYIRVHST